MKLKRYRYLCETDEDMSFLDRLLASKGMTVHEAGAYLRPSFRSAKKLEDFVGLVEAADFVKSLMRENKRIMLFSDYDCDGTLASSIMMRMFRKLGYEHISYMLPSRFDDGYGLNKKAVKLISETGYDAIITLDLGIRDVEAIAYAKSLGLKILLTDHHNIGDELPDADVILNPKLSDSSSLFYMLCGAGVAFYLADFILDDENMDDLFQLAAIATVADIVDLMGDNRAIVKEGIESIRNHAICGVKALIDVSSIDISRFNEEDISFQLAPRINAAGRMKTAEIVIELMLEEDEDRAQALAFELDAINRERKEIESSILEEAVSILSEDEPANNGAVNVVWGDNWHEGVIGIVASKLVDRYMKPAIVMSRSNRVFKASTRSVKSYSIYSAIKAAEAALMKFGGHEMACGFSLHEDKLEYFLDLLGGFVENNLPDDVEANSIDISAELPVSMMTHQSLGELNLLRPFGMGNRAPTFITRNFKLISAYLVGRDYSCLKLKLVKDGRTMDGILFNAPKEAACNKPFRADVVYTLKENIFRDVSSVELMVSDMRIYSVNMGDIQKLAFCYYCLRLNERIIKEQGDVTLVSRKSLTDATLCSHLDKGGKVGVNSYEALLEIMYMLFDRGMAYEELLKGEFLNTVVILPEKDAGCTHHFRKGFYGTDDKERMSLYRSMLFDEMHFDRQYFAKVYNDIRELGRFNILDYLMNSDRVMQTVLALEFFREAGFVSVEGARINYINGLHNKTDYRKSKVNEAYRTFVLTDRF